VEPESQRADGCPLGPVLAVANPAKTPGPLPAELSRRCQEQNQLVASLIEQNDALAKELAKTRPRVGGTSTEAATTTESR